MDTLKRIFKEIGIMIIATLIIAVVFAAIKTVGLMAAECGIIMTDDDGSIVTTVDDFYVTDRAVNFELMNENVLEGGTLVYSIRRDDGRESTFVPAEEGCLRVEPDWGHRFEFRFGVYNETDNGIIFLQGDGQFFGVEFEADNSAPQVTLDGEMVRKEEGIYYFAGTRPVLSVQPVGNGKVYAKVTCLSDSISETVYPVEEPTVLSFSEGEFEVDVYEETSDGKIERVDSFPLHLIYDCTSPSEVDLDVEISEGGLQDSLREDCQIFTNNKAIVYASSSDELAGIDRIQMECGGKTVEADKLTLTSGTWGISALAVDRCGNESDLSEVDFVIMVENEAPEIDVDTENLDGSVVVTLGIHDDDSGLYESYVNWRGDTVRHEQYYRDHIMIDERFLKIEIPVDRDESDGELYVYVRDCAGNVSEETISLMEDDNDAPYIEISGIDNGETVSRDVGLQVRVNDKNVTNSGIAMNMKFYGIDGSQEERVISSEENLKFDKEGRYELKVSAVDGAGNKAENEVGFTIDRSAPVISGLSKYDGCTLKSFSLKDDIQSMFSDDTFVSYRLYLNGKDHSEEDIVDAPGRYTLQVYAVDSAGNMAQDQARFTIEDEDEEIMTDMSYFSKKTGNPRDEIALETAADEEEAESSEAEKKIIENTETGRWVVEWIPIFVMIPLVLVIGFAVWYTLRRKSGKISA